MDEIIRRLLRLTKCRYKKIQVIDKDKLIILMKSENDDETKIESKQVSISMSKK